MDPNVLGVAYGEPFTHAQVDLIAGQAEFWRRRELCTDRCDREDVEFLVARAYQAFGYAEPAVIAWAESPMSGAIRATQLAADHRLLGPSMGPGLYHDLAAQLDQLLGIRVADDLEERVRSLLTSHWPRTSLDIPAALLSQIADAFDRDIKDVVDGDDCNDPVVSWLDAELGPFGDSRFYARLTCQTRMAGLTDTARLSAMAAVAAGVGWWWPMEGAAVLVERPAGISRDANGRLHNASGPAVWFQDGSSLYAWHGMTIPPAVVVRGEWSVDEILSEPNVEVRRCAVERMGWEEFLRRVGAEMVAEVPDPGNSPHTLQLFDMPEELSEAYWGTVRICLCTNGSPERDGTRRRYGVLVSGDYDDPVAAMADTYGVSADVYREMQARR